MAGKRSETSKGNPRRRDKGVTLDKGQSNIHKAFERLIDTDDIESAVRELTNIHARQSGVGSKS